MFESSLKIGSVRGIRIQVHYTWLVIFALLSLSLIAHFRAAHGQWSELTIVSVALVAVLLFFASIVLHELGHSLVALRRGVPVRSITLFIFGGVAQLERDSATARDEFWIAIAGPLVSLALAAGFLVLAGLTTPLHEPLATAFGWLAFINFAVAVFNMIPGFPLDGGRVFRALVWGATGDAAKGVRWAVRGGRITAWSLILLGLFSLVATGNLISAVWLAAIGWFLLNAAEASGKDFSARRVLAGMFAGEVMDSAPPRVVAGVTIRDWVEHSVLPTGTRSGLVFGTSGPVGLVTLTDIRRVAREQWDGTPVEKAMTPLSRLRMVSVDEPLEEVLRIMAEHRLNQVPVVRGAGIVGWIDRQRLLRSLQVRFELGGDSA